jgi:hypothetical protein
MGAGNKGPWWYALIRSRVFEGGYEWALRGLFKLRLRGTESLPRSRPVVLCYNHGSHYDLFFMLAVGRRILGEMPVPVTWQGTLRYPLIGSWLRAWQVVPCSLRGIQPLFKKIPWPDKFWGNVEVPFHLPLDPRAFGSVDELTQAIRRAVASQFDYPLQENLQQLAHCRRSPSDTAPA